jgi:NAD dependent epimerase/dehydratase family enzyme
MQPLDFDGETVWAADALAMLIPNDREAARAVPNEVFVQDRFRLGIFLRSTQRMIEETADEPSDNESDDDPSDNESDGVDEARNSQGQDVARYVKKRYPKKTKHELMTSRWALGRRDTNIAR